MSITRRCALGVIGAISLSIAGVAPVGGAPAGAAHAEIVVADGLEAFVASATGYATSERDALECVGHTVQSCPVGDQGLAPSPAEAADWVAGHVIP